MQITARLTNSAGWHEVEVQTNDNARSLSIPPKTGGPGSSVNGGELLFLALATCYCNDIYREAARLGIQVRQVEVQVSGEFGSPGEPGRRISYRARIEAAAEEEQIAELALLTDRVAEIQNTLRVETPVELTQVEAVRVE